MLDAILMPEWQYRYFSYHSKWGKSLELSRIRDGQGGESFLLFTPNYVLVKGCEPDQSSIDMSQIIKHNELPKEIENYILEPALDWDFTSYYLWLDRSTNEWKFSNLVRDHMNRQLGRLHLLCDDPNVYKEWANEYYDSDLSISEVVAIHDHWKINEIIVRRINPSVSMAELIDDIEDIGYHVAD